MRGSVKEFTDAGSPMVKTSTTITPTITDDADHALPTPLSGSPLGFSSDFHRRFQTLPLWMPLLTICPSWV